MKLSRNQLQALGFGLQVGATILKGLDANATGADDRAGQAFTVAGVTFQQLAAGASVPQKTQAAAALRAIGTAVNALADEIEVGKE